MPRVFRWISGRLQLFAGQRRELVDIAWRLNGYIDDAAVE
jgi:hypothetical protein